MTNHRFIYSLVTFQAYVKLASHKNEINFQFTILNEIKDNDLMQIQTLIYSTLKLVCSL